MSYLSDKEVCVECKELFDPDLLDDGICRDCWSDLRMLNEMEADEAHERGIEEPAEFDPLWD